MKHKWKVWQICGKRDCKHEHPVQIVEVEDGQCVACEAIGAPPPFAREGQAVMLGFVQMDKPMQTQVRDLEVMELKAGLTLSPKHMFIAWLAKAQKGWSCETPTEEMWQDHGL